MRQLGWRLPWGSNINRRNTRWCIGSCTKAARQSPHTIQRVGSRDQRSTKARLASLFKERAGVHLKRPTDQGTTGPERGGWRGGAGGGGWRGEAAGVG